MPNLDNIRKWAEALESGEYKQARSYLAIVGEDGNSYCCLGVACEVAISNGVTLEVTQFEGEDGRVLRYGNRTGVLPIEVAEWLGLDEESPLLGHYRATDLNDNMGRDFTEIARCVREEYLTGA